MSNIKRILSLLLCFIFFSCAVYSQEPTATEIFNETLDITEEYYHFGITKEQLLQSAVDYLLENNPEMLGVLSKGAYEALDENSYYLTKEEYLSRLEDVTMEISGIGAMLQVQNGKPTITEVIRNSPAIVSGLKAGDVILNVNGIPVFGYAVEDVVKLVRGPKGTSVNLQIERNGKILDFKIIRSVITLETVSYKKLEKNNSGYVKIDSFSNNTYKEFQTALLRLASAGVDKIILDLRNNPGGYLISAVNIANFFVPESKPLVTEDFPGDDVDFTYFSQGDFERFKVVVLVNEYSASASEVVTGAIKINKAGIVVGTTTFGKGTVQSSHELPNGDGLWLTVAQYNLPDGTNIHGTGINPDYFVQNEVVPVNLTQMPNITKEKVLKIGDKTEQVQVIKQYLEVLGFTFRENDDFYDDEMFEAIKLFQGSTGLYPYGVADITTQAKILEMAGQATKTIDNQLEKAKELIYEMR
ncbi:MAG: S41 family peptidase [Clostridia bacterium]|nr:S41 family peptidase [Clostridia bacterium]